MNRRWVRGLGVGVVLALLFLSCGDSNTGPTDNGGPPPPPPPPPVQPASITLDADNAIAFVSDEGNVFVFDLTIIETGGGGANINFIALDVVRPTGEFVERSEIGAGEIIRVTGSNRIEANETRVLEDVAFLFRSAFKGGPTMVVTVGFTDDTGRDFESVISFVFTGPAPLKRYDGDVWNRG